RLTSSRNITPSFKSRSSRKPVTLKNHGRNDDEPNHTKQRRVLTQKTVFMMFAVICFVAVTYGHKAGVLAGLPQSDCCCSQDMNLILDLAIELSFNMKHIASFRYATYLVADPRPEPVLRAGIIPSLRISQSTIVNEKIILEKIRQQKESSWNNYKDFHGKEQILNKRGAKLGVETIDVATGLKFNMRAMVLWTINDFLARSSLSGWSGQGYMACLTCNEDTPSVRVLGKTAYVGHRRFLKKPHKWRRSLEFNGETENGDPPREFNRDAIMTQLARLPTRVKGKHPRFRGVKIKHNVLVELNWTKRSIFYELEYWSFLTLKHNLDVMHIEKNVLESILNTLLMNDKSKDTAKARQDLKSLGIRSGLWLGQNKNEKCSKPQAAYSFKPEDRKKFCQFIKGVKLPDGFGSNFKHKVTDIGLPI
ncbi:zinc finger, PHD-type containing protein, partial [Tanacetum coccineum]